jgi:outer membrane biosynthesis protein TonB
MNAASLKVVVVSLALMLTLTGCNKKKQATLPPQSQAPTVETPKEPEPTASAPAEPSTVEPSTNTPSTTTAPSEPATTATATTTKPKPKPRKPKNNNKPVNSASDGTVPPATATPPANNSPTQNSKVVVPQGGEAAPGQISAAGPDDDGRSRQTIEQLLQSTDTNLRSINRQLNDNERAMVEQIKTYMAQARTASTDGDLTRANNLALKAHLLSDELVKR